jgi:hypothetical protein
LFLNTSPLAKKYSDLFRCTASNMGSINELGWFAAKITGLPLGGI